MHIINTEYSIKIGDYMTVPAGVSNDDDLILNLHNGTDNDP